ncbi:MULTISPECIES: YqaA family protein [unclassified Rhizobium]|uniref:YqaA family protein n=1 Tax=unclassified Rhizobium TaxID=2613769 RepID=UPI001ADBBDB5|nr:MULTISPECIES: YqaA family protein [unclassified Rhizobium]MBO9122929.1 DedA family protein [Rhizobium sp. 16-488-2b]MBO9173461.1 DedA family protein [Rhizobium sp. 16-488-2a]
MTTLAAYAGLFAISLIAATILPAQSEAGLVALILSGQYSTLLLVIVASVGNILGSLVNWLLGIGIERFRHKRWFPVGEVALDRAQRWYRRYGKWSLLASWLPIVGDPITVVAGVMREPLPVFLLLVTIAKTARYAVLAVITLGIVG